MGKRSIEGNNRMVGRKVCKRGEGIIFRKECWKLLVEHSLLNDHFLRNLNR